MKLGCEFKSKGIVFWYRDIRKVILFLSLRDGDVLLRVENKIGFRVI